MNSAMLTNIVTMAFCIAVLVQSVRMMRSLKAIKEGALTNMVDALDKATCQAQLVLSELKETLGDCAANSRILIESREIAEELGVMIGIADASAERILEANGAGRANHAAASRVEIGEDRVAA